MSNQRLPCAAIPFGSYEHQVSMRCPWNKKWVCIDACLATEIAWLWLRGIRTIESCCGHGKLAGYIAVEPDYVEQMKHLGYEHEPGRTDVFLPKCHDL